MSVGRGLGAVIACALLCGALPARAQVTGKPAFSAERFTPSPGPALLAVALPDVAQSGTWILSAVASLSSRPIVLRDLDSDAIVAEPVAHRLGLELGGAIGLGARYQLGVGAPLAIQDGDRLRGAGIDEAPLARAALGDVRLAARARLVGDPGQAGLGATAELVAVLPTGDDDQFAGEAGTVVEMRVAVGARRARWAVAANLAARLRTREVIVLPMSRPLGNELVGGVGAAVALGWGERLWWMAEVVQVVGDRINGRRGPYPGEARAGVRLQLGPWALTAGGGAGITPDQVGSPAWRIIGQVAWEGGTARSRAPADASAAVPDSEPDPGEAPDTEPDIDSELDVDPASDR